MKEIIFFVLLLMLSGCSGRISSPLLGMELNLDSPILGYERKLPVVYPYQSEVYRRSDPMAQAFGASWQNSSADYPEFRFNP